MRERRGSYNRCVVGFIPSFCWIIIKKGLDNLSGGCSPHWVNHVYLCLYCIVYILCFISTFVLFYFSTILFFQQLVSEQKVTRRKRGFLFRMGAMEKDGKFRVEKFNDQNYQ
jgi:hypothetical protein